MPAEGRALKGGRQFQLRALEPEGMATISVSGTGWTPKPSITFAACSGAICPARALAELGVVG